MGRPVTLLQRISSILGKRMACPPDPGSDARLMIFVRAALAYGPGNPRNSIHLTHTWRKVKGSRQEVSGEEDGWRAWDDA